MHRVANFVRPIMKSWSLKVGTLCEMFPRNANLLGLNVNHGAKVCLRLRPHHDEYSFLPFEDIIGTMLHELVHNRRGPHDAEFYRLLDKMKAELEALMAKGWRGDNFFGAGRVLGHGSGRRLGSTDLVAQRRAEALEQRIKLTKGSGQKLGGSSDATSAFDPSVPLRERVRIAAERRAEDAKWCASQRQDLTAEELGGESDIEEIGIVVREPGEGSSPSTNLGIRPGSPDDLQEVPRPGKNGTGAQAPTKAKRIYVDLT